ncbi:hypothetical protein [Vibrio coralliilyticus]|uniref:hypothetical protein n=1 Tax=Vibrio coralliilyticus TaxID=190893 RepID=UPI00148D03CC|nr:hypothetical protein [Vibrio coralliilyticus]NOI30197.1 hypothetical protein [Vibrio coralliilyticus]NOI46829.1 hypothetical protein [Vibrio coralliilyticus]
MNKLLITLALFSSSSMANLAPEKVGELHGYVMTISQFHCSNVDTPSLDLFGRSIYGQVSAIMDNPDTKKGIDKGIKRLTLSMSR